MDKNTLLRQIPQVDRLLQSPEFKDLGQNWGAKRLAKNLDKVLNNLRQDILDEKIQDARPLCNEAILATLKQIEFAENRVLVHKLINCTGIPIHTNMGRTPLSAKIMDKVKESAENYSNLEYIIEEGHRGTRYAALEKIICELLGVEAALVVNNNAAAVMLMLREIAKGKAAVVSRGELVEIGGKFRVPDVMEESGATLLEVGTTNKTRVEDYAEVMSEDVACILKVHRSNFRLEGFAEEASIEELVGLAHEYDSILMYDLGSGLMHPEPPALLKDEPTVQEAVAAGCDLISFSGDKLLGGPQAGIIIGRKHLIDRIKQNPLTRALRCDKMTLVALQETLLLYPDVEQINTHIPLFNMLSIPDEELAQRAMKVQDMLIAGGLSSVISQPTAEIGGGSAPGVRFLSVGISLEASQVDFHLKDMEEEVRLGDPVVIAYLNGEMLNFDLRTVKKEDLEILAQAILEAAERSRARARSN